MTFEDPSFFRCPRCGWQHPDPLSQREGLPWERRREIGRIVALWETTKLLLLSPTAAMRMMRNDRAVDAAVYFWVMCAVAGATNALIIALFLWAGAASPTSGYDPFAEIAITSLFVMLSAMAVIGFLGSVALHIATLSQPKGSLSLAVTLYRYCAGSGMLLCTVPYAGWIAGIICCNVVLVIGLVSLYGMSRSKAIGILILQKALFAFLGFALFMWFTS